MKLHSQGEFYFLLVWFNLIFIFSYWLYYFHDSSLVSVALYSLVYLICVLIQRPTENCARVCFFFLLLNLVTLI